MQFKVHAKGNGKFIRVTDKNARADAFDKFVDADQIGLVDVVSPDGNSGLVDIHARNTREQPEFEVQLGYEVRKDETVDIDDQ